MRIPVIGSFFVLCFSLNASASWNGAWRGTMLRKYCNYSNSSCPERSDTSTLVISTNGSKLSILETTTNFNEDFKMENGTLRYYGNVVGTYTDHKISFIFKGTNNNGCDQTTEIARTRTGVNFDQNFPCRSANFKHFVKGSLDVLLP